MTNMRIANRYFSFKPGPWPTAGAAIMIALTLHLANWQRNRAAEKRILQNHFEERVRAAPILLGSLDAAPELLQYRRVVAQGQWLPGSEIYLDNKTEGGIAGYQLITPLRLKGGQKTVLVNRGWIARSPSYPNPPVVATPSGDVEVAGMIVMPSTHFLELSETSMVGNVWQNLTIERFRRNRQIAVLPFVVLAESESPDSLPPLKKSAETPNAGVEKHVEYMLTWLSLAGTVFALWLVLNLKISPLSTSSPTGNAQ